MKDGDGFGFDPSGKTAGGDEVFDLGVISAVAGCFMVVGRVGRGRRVGRVRVFVLMVMDVAMSVFFLVVVMFMFMLVQVIMVFARMRLTVRDAIFVSVFVAVVMREVNVEFNAFDGGFVSAGNVQMITVKIQLSQFVLKFVGIRTQIEQCADKHVAADPAEDVQI
jgi:hypothetical protein